MSARFQWLATLQRFLWALFFLTLPITSFPFFPSGLGGKTLVRPLAIYPMIVILALVTIPRLLKRPLPRTILPLLALGSWRAMSHADAQGVIPDRELGLLRGVPMLRVLPLTVLEQVAADLRPMGFAAGEGIIHRGEVGDRFYVIAAGEVEVRVGNRVMRRQGAGESFGEVALLRDVRRTADVYALTDVQLYALDRVAFRCAVTGDRQSREAADDVVGSRLAAG